MSTQPVIIVGAGPVGLTVALSLAHQGVPVQVLEAEAGLTVDQRAGVQVGELIRVTREGFERLHAAPRGFFRV
jgi:2-polyprenyl-6-methoxyphenol hydroxylase-like FAD-dependent oxidoreductase